MKKKNILLIIICAILFFFSFFILSKKHIPLNPQSFNENEVMVQDLTEDIKKTILYQISDYQNKYEDFYGWIYVSGTNVSIPIAQSDDNEFYLRKGFNKIYSMDGTTFVDYTNTRNPDEELNLVIYGHNLENTKQFSTLLYLQDKNIIKQSKIYLFQKNHIYIYEPFAVYTTDVKFNYIKTRFRGLEFTQLLEQILEKNEIELNIPVTENDKIITLSTCTNENKNERFVVNGVLKKIE